MRLGISRICVPTDFSEAADHAVHFGAALASSYNAVLHQLHVVEHGGPLIHHPDFSGSGEVARAYFSRLEQQVAEAEDDSPQDISELLKSIEATASEQIKAVGKQWWESIEVVRATRYGHPAKEVNQYVQKHKIDLVVIGTHGHSQLGGMLLGSVTEKVVRSCPCPVTVVRHPEHQYELLE